MALVIRNGMLMTMTEQGSFRGDMMISGGRILKIAERLEALEGFEHDELDASGMTILPGMIDLYVRDGGAEPAWLAETALDAGVTTAVLLPESGERCTLLGTGGLRNTVHAILPEGLTDQQLSATLACAGREDAATICIVRSERHLKRVLECGSGNKGIVLAELTGCENHCPEIAESGFGVVLGVVQQGGRGPWRMAVELHEAGVPTALSSCYPACKMKLLPVCASLCVRDGMAREDALKAVTSVPVDLLKLQDRGVLREGCRADLAIYDGDPLLLATSHVMTIADGRLHRRR